MKTFSTLSSLLAAWRSDPETGANIYAWQTTPEASAHVVPIPDTLHPSIRQALHTNGVEALYSHQLEALKAVENNRNVIIATGTASGKTLCYNLPVIQSLLVNSRTRALYLFPTKALAQDQHQQLMVLTRHLPQENNLLSAIYDGDTPSQNRPMIREMARVVISNPDMLHSGILPHHTRWVEFFRNLNYVIIDEVHTYRGVFGSHFANLIRRLKRVTRFYGSKPQFLMTSATIGNPVELAQGLVEEPVTLIDNDGAPHGKRHFLLYNPPVIDTKTGIRKSMSQEVVRLAGDVLSSREQVLIFGRTRRSVEMLLNYMRLENAHLSSSIRGYRSGYLPRQRREIENGLRSGDIRAVAATNALELGIDIGGMGAVILAGYPGSVAAARQQAGRAGRRGDSSVAILVATPEPIDQFLMRQPQYLLGRSPENALINPNNALILLHHLRCAAFELPFHQEESFGNLPAQDLQAYLDYLVEEHSLYHSGNTYFWMADQYPAEKISLRSTSPSRVVLVADEETGARTIGEVDYASALWMVHPQAIYLHEGQTYLVQQLDLQNNVARLQPTDVDYFTEDLTEYAIQLVEQQKDKELIACTAAYGEIQVTSKVTGFRRTKWYTRENLGAEPLDLPPYDLLTTGAWLALSEQAVEDLRKQGLWANDPNKYGPNWDTMRELARQRDGYTCQVCGNIETDRAHHVHHKVPFRGFESYMQANVLENLVTLCASCHRKVETAVRIQSGLAGLAYVLSNLAPLYLMCDRRDIRVVSESQSTLALGRPAVILYDLVPGGIGLSDRFYDLVDQVLQDALRLVLHCECEDGCPSCIGPAGENAFGGKHYTLAILSALNGTPYRSTTVEQE